MILRMPEYCRGFRCSAGDCSDSCCIGWEIDIDKKTAEYYEAVQGHFGERLRNNISVDDGYSFVLKNERCPFLNEKNLCEVILTLGEDKLCHICNEHPRYYEWFRDVKEGGIGLCCEEAAKLIISKGDTEEYYEREIPYEDCDDYDEALYHFLFEARERINSLFRSVDIKTAVYSVLRYTENIQELIDNGVIENVPEIILKTTGTQPQPDTDEMLDIFDGLEPIDKNWKPFIGNLKNMHIIPNTNKYEKYLKNIGIYFVWRYFMKSVFDGEVISKIKLAVISMAMLNVVFSAEEADYDRCVILAKNFSKETEYSEENLETLYDMSYTENVFSDEELVKFFA